jgi:pimeloyl-ACP methyl ester carboxylesterase
MFRPLLVLLLASAAAAQGPVRSGTAEADGAALYFELHGSGSGTPLVLVEGLGAATWLWERQLPALAEAVPVVVYDNRGVGRSDAPPGPYTIGQLADDLAVVLDTLGIDRAHVLGASMGGFVAQEFALRYPERVDRLVLVSTSAGGATHVPMAPEVLQQMMAPPATDDPRALVRSRLPLAFTEAFLADSATVAHLVDQRLERPQPPHAYQAQLVAGATFDAADRVSQITAPTLVAAASDDLVVPVENAHRLADALPNAELKVYPGLGHQFFVEAPDAFNRDVLAFLRADPPCHD